MTITPTTARLRDAFKALNEARANHKVLRMYAAHKLILLLMATHQRENMRVPSYMGLPA